MSLNDSKFFHRNTLDKISGVAMTPYNKKGTELTSRNWAIKDKSKL